MLRSIIIIALLLTQSVSAQELSSEALSLLKEHVLGDTIFLRQMPKESIRLELEEVLEYVDYEKHSVFELAINDTIQKFSDTSNLKAIARIEKQVNLNNTVEWRSFAESRFTHWKKGKAKGSNNFSIPIFYSPNKAMVVVSWAYDALYAGQRVDFWEFKEGEWVKLKEAIIWMS